MATRGCLNTPEITPGACIGFLLALVHQHVVALGASNVERAVALVAKEHGLEVGAPMPELQKYAGGKWVAFHAGRKQWRRDSRRIAVQGKETQGKQLGSFNRGRESRITYDSLRTARVVTPDLRALLAYLGHVAAVESPMPPLLKETAAGWVPVTVSPRPGDNNVGRVGTGEPHAKWYLSWPGRANPMQIKNARTLQGRLDFQGRKRPDPDARFSTCRMTMDRARAEFVEGRAHSRAEHVAACTPRAEALSVPAGWTAFAGSVVSWLFLRGAFLTRTGSYNINAQFYHVLEYFVSALQKLIAGQSPDLFKTNLLQQLEAARHGKHYVKRRSRYSELCLGYKCWTIAFCAFKRRQNNWGSGEATLMKLVGDDVAAFKEAVGTERESSYFRLIVPEDGEASPTLVAGKRKIFEETDGDHGVSNARVDLPRLCSRGAASATDYRFIHQKGEATGKHHWNFGAEPELRSAALPALREFLADVLAMPRGAAYLPEIDPDFEVVTEDLVSRVVSWLDFPWTTAIPQDVREAFLSKYGAEQRPCKRPRRA